jgi:hypothetical protein
MVYIRDHYNVPARRGARVIYHGDGTPKSGTIVGTKDAHLRIRLDGEQKIRSYHPTWCIEYTEGGR